MRKVWIVVGNSSHAKIYIAEDDNLVAYKSLEHPESHLERRDLKSDRTGSIPQRFGYGTDSMAEPTSLKTKESMAFAREIAEFLDKGWYAGEFDHLYIVAKPTFLGHLRKVLSKNVAKTVVGEIDKDLILARPEKIREYLPLVL